MSKKNKITAPKQSQTSESLSTETWLPLVLAVVAFVLFAAGFKNAMLEMDDHSATLNNPAVTDLDFFSKFNLGMFAPLTWLGYAIAYKLGGEHTFWYHFMGALVHAFNVWMVFRIFRQLGSSMMVAGLVAFFFGVHPLQVEPVTWIAGFSTPLFSMFLLLSISAYLKHFKSETTGKYYWISLFMFLLACLAKSAAVTLPLTLVVLDLWGKRPLTRSAWMEKIPFFLISIGFGALTLVSRQQAGQLDQPADFSMLDRGLMACQTILFYWTKILAPVGLSIWYPFVKNNGVWPWTYYVAPVVLAGILYYAWRVREVMPLLWIGLLFYLSNIILSLPWATFGTFELRSDRYNYLAILGIFAFLTAIPDYLAEKKPGWTGGAWAILVAAGAMWLFLSGFRIREWKDTTTLIESALASTGDNFGKAYLWRGIIEAQTKNGQAAIQDFNRAIAANPNLYDAYKWRGNIGGPMKLYEQSILDLTKYLDKYPDDAPQFYNRGLSLVNIGQDSLAVLDFDKCISLDPKMSRAYRARGNTYIKLGQKEKGDADLQEYERLSGNKQ